jgi:hypothetical protein
MKKVNSIPIDEDDDMLPEYDFTGKKGVRGKYYLDRRQGYTIRVHNEDGTITETRYGPEVRLDADVYAFFPDAESVNRALRALIALIPNKQVGEKKAKYAVRKKSTKSIAARK